MIRPTASPLLDLARRFLGPALTFSGLLAALPPAPANGDSLPEQIQRGAELLERTRLDEAETHFAATLARAEAEGGRWWEAAAFGYATALHQKTPIRRQNIERALTLFERIHSQSPDSEYGKQALLMTARIHELPDYPADPIRLDLAREIYRRLAEDHRNESIGLEAAIRYASTYLQEAALDHDLPVSALGTNIELPERAAAFLEAYLRETAPSPLRNAGWEYLGRVYWRGLRDESRTLIAWLHATGDQAMLSGGQPIPEKQNVDRINPGYLYWGIATLAQRLDERPIAIEYYSRIITEVPRYKSTMSQVRLRELGVPESEIPQVSDFAKRR